MDDPIQQAVPYAEEPVIRDIAADVRSALELSADADAEAIIAAIATLRERAKKLDALEADEAERADHEIAEILSGYELDEDEHELLFGTMKSNRQLGDKLVSKLQKKQTTPAPADKAAEVKPAEKAAEPPPKPTHNPRSAAAPQDRAKEVAAAIQAARRERPNLTFAQAMDAVRRARPELFTQE